MPEISEHTPIPGNVDLSAEAKAARVAAIFTPYHDRIRGPAGRARQPAHGAGRDAQFHASFKGESRAMQVGMLYNKDPGLAQHPAGPAAAEGDLVVGDNAPYAVTEDSDYGVPTHGEKRGLAHVEIEIRQDLIATPDGQHRLGQPFRPVADRGRCGAESRHGLTRCRSLPPNPPAGPARRPPKPGH